MKEVKASAVFNRKWRLGHKYRLLYWPITSFFDHYTLCYLQDLSSPLPISGTQPILTNGPLGPLWPRFSICRLDSAASWYCLKTHTPRPSHGHLHVSFHNSHDFRSTTWLSSLIITGASCSEKSLIDGSVKG